MPRTFGLPSTGAGCLCALLVLAATAGYAPSGNAGEEPEAPAPPPPEPPVRLAPERDEALLRSALAYLRLSRRQLSQLLLRAQQTDRRLIALARQEAETARAIERLAGRDPQHEARLQQGLAETRGRELAEIAVFAAPQMIRLFTREQTGLASRLTEGRPPKRAQADPALLEPAAGFVPSKRRELPHPFPQRLAESMDPAELAPAVEPLARRLFTSRRFLPVLEQALARGLPRQGPATQPGTRLSELRRIRDYRMERGLGDRTGRGPALQALGGRVEHGFYEFEAGQGLRLADAGVTDHYALDIFFRYRKKGGFQKLIDFKNGTEDAGLYLHDDEFLFVATPWPGGGGSHRTYTLATTETPAPGRDVWLRLERDRSTRIVRIHLDSRQVAAFVDLDDDAVFEKRAGLLFVDDTPTGSEVGAGALASLTVWGKP